jgi:hypothetical protein
MRIVIASLAIAAALSTPAFAQTDPALCDQPDGYIEVYKQFVEGWADAVQAGTLVDPQKTDIAVWVEQWKNRMIQGTPVHDLCVEMVQKRGDEGF